MDIVERRIEQARRDGAFDGLALHGKPIPDLDTERPEGWWGEAYLERDRARRALHELGADLRHRAHVVMLADDHDEVRTGLVALAGELDRANATVDADDRLPPLDVDGELRGWRARRRQRRFGRYLTP